MPDTGSRTAPAEASLRAFVAVPLPDAIRDALGDLQGDLDRRLPQGAVRWTKPQGIHLTLKFLGETPVSRLAAAETALAVIARNAPAFSCAIGPVGCFPNFSRPRVVYVGVVEPSGRLSRLHGAIEEALGRISFPPEARRFTPHLTLGRVNRRASRDAAARVGQVVESTAFDSRVEVSADRFELIRSVLRPTGAEYTVLSAYPLRQVAPPTSAVG
jgi:2'-5' RNA ligase